MSAQTLDALRNFSQNVPVCFRLVHIYTKFSYSLKNYITFASHLTYLTAVPDFLYSLLFQILSLTAFSFNVTLAPVFPAVVQAHLWCLSHGTELRIKKLHFEAVQGAG